MIWLTLSIPIKFVVGIVLSVIDALGSLLGEQQDWHRRWQNWTIPLTTEERLREFWTWAGHDPGQDYWLIYDSQQVWPRCFW